MVKSLFFILTFGFFIQCTGSNNFLKKTFVKTETCSNDSSDNGGKNNVGYKSDQEKFANFQNLKLSTSLLLCSDFQSALLYPTGYISDPFLPPRTHLS